MTPENYIVGKVKYDDNSCYVFDEDNNIILDVRGWGKISGMFNEEQSALNFHDEVGRFVASAINEKLSKVRNERI
jgi:hypothetical protein